MSDSPRALVVKLSSLGDVFHALPAVHELKRGLGISIDWMTQPEYAELVGCFSDVDRVLTFPRRDFFRSFPAWSRELRRSHYDYVFDFQGLIKSGLVARTCRAERRIGPSFAREGTRWFYDAIAGQMQRDRHAVDEALDFARYFNLPTDTPRFPVTFPRTSLDAPGPRIAYLPCSRWATKNWPPEYFASLIRDLHRSAGGTAFLIGAKGDQDVCDRIALASQVPVHNRCGQTTIPELGGLLQEMDLLITVDSGPMHMAAALGIPVLAIFGSTDPVRTGPYGRSNRVIQHGDLVCQPCRSRTCLRPQRDTACMRDLKADRVVAEAEALLAELAG